MGLQVGGYLGAEGAFLAVRAFVVCVVGETSPTGGGDGGGDGRGDGDGGGDGDVGCAEENLSGIV